MPVKVRKKIYPIGGGSPLGPELLVDSIHMIFNRGLLISKKFVLEDGRWLSEEDLIFTETDPDELAALETEARMLAEKPNDDASLRRTQALRPAPWFMKKRY